MNPDCATNESSYFTTCFKYKCSVCNICDGDDSSKSYTFCSSQKGRIVNDKVKVHDLGWVQSCEQNNEGLQNNRPPKCKSSQIVLYFEGFLNCDLFDKEISYKMRADL